MTTKDSYIKYKIHEIRESTTVEKPFGTKEENTGMNLIGELIRDQADGLMMTLDYTDAQLSSLRLDLFTNQSHLSGMQKRKLLSALDALSNRIDFITDRLKECED